MGLESVKILRRGGGQSGQSDVTTGYVVAQNLRETVIPLPEGILPCLELVAESGETFYIVLNQEVTNGTAAK